jgi:hypothetical protein
VSWESRGGRGRYYTRSRWVNGRIVREYVGGGQRGEQAAAEDARRRAERRAEVDRVRDYRARHRSADGFLDALAADVDLLVEAVLIGAGFHRRNRGPWRKRRAPG